MLYTLVKTLTTHGTPEALSSTRIAASWATIQAFSGNGGAVYIGGVDENHDPNVANSTDNGGASKGHKLSPGDFVNLRELGGPTYLDLRYVYIDGDSSGDKVNINYGRR